MDDQARAPTPAQTHRLEDATVGVGISPSRVLIRSSAAWEERTESESRSASCHDRGHHCQVSIQAAGRVRGSPVSTSRLTGLEEKAAVCRAYRWAVGSVRTCWGRGEGVGFKDTTTEIEAAILLTGVGNICRAAGFTHSHSCGTQTQDGASVTFLPGLGDWL